MQCFCENFGGNWPCLTHWGWVTHFCVSKLTIIDSDNGLSPERRQAIIWTNAGILSIGTLETNLSEILSEIHTFSFKKMHLKTSSGKRRPSCLGLNVLIIMGLQCIPVTYLSLHQYQAVLVGISASIWMWQKTGWWTLITTTWTPPEWGCSCLRSALQRWHQSPAKSKTIISYTTELL